MSLAFAEVQLTPQQVNGARTFEIDPVAAGLPPDLADATSAAVDAQPPPAEPPPPPLREFQAGFMFWLPPDLALRGVAGPMASCPTPWRRPGFSTGMKSSSRWQLVRGCTFE
jgi:hypothetical protein